MDRGTGLDLILVVEDGLDLYDLVTAVLEIDPRVTTAKAEGGEHALSLARTMRPDVIVLDVRRPSLGALRVARQLKADPATRAIPRVAMTSDPQARSISRACDFRVTRPYDLVTLIERLREPREAAA